MTSPDTAVREAGDMSEVSGRPRPIRPAATRPVSATPRAGAHPRAVDVQDAADVAVYAAAVAVAAGRAALGIAVRGTRGTLQILPVPAPVRRGFATAWQAAQVRGRDQRTVAIAEVRTAADFVVPQVVDEIVARVDIDAVLQRIDLTGLAEYVVESIDLPAIVRTSSESVTREMIRGIRSTSADADEALARAVDRILRRRRPRRLASGSPNGTNGATPS